MTGKRSSRGQRVAEAVSQYVDRLNSDTPMAQDELLERFADVAGTLRPMLRACDQLAEDARVVGQRRPSSQALAAIRAKLLSEK
jgi:hypothetical protein